MRSYIVPFNELKADLAHQLGKIDPPGKDLERKALSAQLDGLGPITPPEPPAEPPSPEEQWDDFTGGAPRPRSPGIFDGLEDFTPPGPSIAPRLDFSGVDTSRLTPVMGQAEPTPNETDPLGGLDGLIPADRGPQVPWAGKPVAPPVAPRPTPYDDPGDFVQSVPGVQGAARIAADAAGDITGAVTNPFTVLGAAGSYAAGLQPRRGRYGNYPALDPRQGLLSDLPQDIQTAGPNVVRRSLERQGQAVQESLQGQPDYARTAGELILPMANPATFYLPSGAPAVARGAGAVAREAGPLARGLVEGAQEAAQSPTGRRILSTLADQRGSVRMPGFGTEAAGGNLLGSVTRATGADPTKAYEFRYRVVSLDELVPSHTDALTLNPDFPQELQPRMRERAASRVQINKIASELVPDALLSDVQQLDRGPMITGADGIVESGNGRVLALRRAREAYPEQFAAYQQELQRRLPEYGIDPASVQGVQNPVLVRERITPVDRAAFAAEANQATTLTMSAYEQALQDAGRISDNALANLQVGENQSLDSALQMAGNRGIVQQFVANIPENERAAVIGPRGELSQPGIQRLKAALFARTYPGEAGQRLTQTFFESLDPTIKNVENAMLSSLPAMGKAEGLIRAGLREADLSLAEDLSKAVNILARLREQGMNVDQYLSQAAMFERELTPFQESLLQYLNQNGRSPKRIREFISGYADAVEQSPVKGQGAFFDMGAPTKGDILDGIARRQARADADALPLFAQAQEATPAFSQGSRLEEPAGAGQAVTPPTQRAPEARQAPPQAMQPPAEVPPVQSAPATSKAPWQMTLGELNRAGYIAFDTATGRAVVKPSAAIDEAVNASEHRRAVAAAVARGESVPPAVLAEYPDLAPQTQRPPAGTPPPTAQAPTVPAEVQAARAGDSAPLRAAYGLTQDQADQLLRRLDRGEPFDGALTAVAGRRPSAPSAQSSRPFTPPERPGAENQPLQLVADPDTGQLRFVQEGATLPPRPTGPTTTKPTKATRVKVGTRQPEDATALAQESLGRAVGTPEQAAELRRPLSGYAGNVRLERFDPEVRTLIQQGMDETNQMAGQRRGVVPDAEVQERAAELALGTPIAAWLKTKPGRAFNAEEATALGLTLDRVGMEFNTLAGKAQAARDAGTLTAEMEKELAEKALQFAALEATLSGGTSEAGRTLRAFRLSLEGGTRYKTPQAEAIKRAFNAIGMDEDAFKEWVTRWNALAPDDTMGRYQLLQALHKPTRMQKLVAWTVSNMFSVQSIGGNFVGNLGNSINRPLVTALGGDLRAATDDVVAMGRAMGVAWANAGTSFVTGVRPSLAAEAARLGKYDARPDAFPGLKGVALTPALRALVAGDEFARTINAAGALANIARRQAKSSGRTVREALATPTEGMLKYAQDAADQSVYEGKPSPIAQMLLQGRNRIYQEGAANRATGMAFYVLTPFVRVPDAIIGKGIAMTAKPVTGPVQIARALRRGDREAARRHLGETILATGALAAFYAEAAAGNITGDGPQNPSQRRVLMEARDKDGNPIWQPHSIRIGGRWFDYTNLGHYAIPMATMANAVEAYRYEGRKPDPEYAAAVVNRTVKVMADASYIRGIGSIFRAIYENRVSDLAATTPTDVASRFVPYGGLVAQAARASDTDVKAPRNPLEGVAARIPVLNRLTPERLSVFGEPIERPVDVWSAVSPFRATAPGEPNAAAVELARLGLGLTPADDSIRIPGEATPRKLTGDQQRAYQQELGQAWRSTLTALFDQPYYKAASDEDKKKRIATIENRARDWAQANTVAQLQGQPTPYSPEELQRRAVEFPAALGLYLAWQGMPGKMGMSAKDANEAARISSFYSQVKTQVRGNEGAARELTIQQFGGDALQKMQAYNSRPEDPRKAQFWQRNRSLLDKYFKGAAGEAAAMRQAG